MCIVSYSVIIDPSAVGTPIVGDVYSLNCSVSEASDPATYQWFKGPADNQTTLTSDASRTVSSTSSVSQLQFPALRASDAGLYTCQASIGGVTVEGTRTVEVICKFCFHNILHIHL